MKTMGGSESARAVQEGPPLPAPMMRAAPRQGIRAA